MIGDWLLKRFGGDPTFFETMTHHDAAMQRCSNAIPPSMRLAPSLEPVPPLERSTEVEGTAEATVEY